MAAAQISPPAPADANIGFLEEVSARTAGVSRLEMCIQCGTCGGSCPSADSMDHTPRMLFAMIRAGMKDEALRSNTPWMCVSCYHCVVRCPQGVHIADVMYTLKCMAEDGKTYRDKVPPHFAGVFVGQVERFGRSWEMGLTARHYLRHYIRRLPRMTPMAMSMFFKGRIHLLPPGMKDHKQLHAILERAKELEKAQ
jgi:quinone-modifying oxidoreductase subunit QmoC